jgi:hypothetical protein
MTLKPDEAALARRPRGIHGLSEGHPANSRNPAALQPLAKVRTALTDIDTEDRPAVISWLTQCGLIRPERRGGAHG